jgi:site-specific recombinase XerD
VRWAKLPTRVQPSRWATRLAIVRQFAEYFRTIDPRTEIPPRDLLPGTYRRKPPYLYDNDEIHQLVQAAWAMRSPTGLRAWTYATLLGLLTVTGLRITEALALDRRDVDLRDGVLAIHRTKCRKERLVPVHETTRRALLRYARVRDGVHPRRKTEAFLVSEDGRRLNHCSVREIFVRLSRRIGIRTRVGRFGHGPRLHDLRHRLAVNTLVRWYRSGVDVERRLPVLSTYLGHTKVSDTYWYLEAIPELLRLALARVERAGVR